MNLGDMIYADVAILNTSQAKDAENVQ